MLLNSMKQSYTNSLVFHNYKTRKYILKHHKLGPVKAFVTVETYRPGIRTRLSPTKVRGMKTV